MEKRIKAFYPGRIALLFFSGRIRQEKAGRKIKLEERWRNVYNSIEVFFGIEGDLLNENGDICEDIQGVTGNFLILSAHGPIYQSDPPTITQAYLRALERYADKISVVGHPDLCDFEKQVDIDAVVRAANEHQVPLEFNCANLVNRRTNLDNLRRMLRQAERVYVNSDAHTLHELGTVRKAGFGWLRKEEFI